MGRQQEVVNLEKIETRSERTGDLRLAIGRPPISTRFLEPKVEILTRLEEGSTNQSLMGRI